MQLARISFMCTYYVPLSMVALVTSSNSVAHLLSGPITGLLVDRFGRKPLLLIGLLIRGSSTFAEYFATSYPQYLAFEFIGGFGVAIWLTGSTVLLADMTAGENRARAVALRTMSSRLGFIAGPAIGAVVANVWSLPAVFMFVAITKAMLVAIVGLLIGETRPAEQQAEDGSGRARHTPGRLPLETFLTRSFLVIAITTFAISLMQQGVFSSLFPVYLRSVSGIGTGDVGTLLTISYIAVFAVSFPNGMLTDRYGRKLTLVPGLVLYAMAALLFLAIHDFSSAILVLVFYGVADGVCFGVSQVYAMDLAPRDRRGAFLGVWTLLTQSGSAVAPLIVGSVAERFGFAPVFVTVAALLVGASLVMGFFGPNTRTREQRAVAASAQATAGSS